MTNVTNWDAGDPHVPAGFETWGQAISADVDAAVQPGDDAGTLGSGVAADGQVLTAGGAGVAAWVAPADAPALVNTDGDPGQTIYVGTVDPDVSYTPAIGDVWIEVP